MIEYASNVEGMYSSRSGVGGPCTVCSCMCEEDVIARWTHFIKCFHSMSLPFVKHTRRRISPVKSILIVRARN